LGLPPLLLLVYHQTSCCCSTMYLAAAVLHLSPLAPAVLQRLAAPALACRQGPPHQTHCQFRTLMTPAGAAMCCEVFEAQQQTAADSSSSRCGPQSEHTMEPCEAQECARHAATR
jgi:hypothetical protein